MGKWSQVKCNCSNRNIVSYKGFTETIYECGHKNGMLIEYWQGDLMKIGYALKVAFTEQTNCFEMLKKLVDTATYSDELLLFSVEDAEFLKLELEKLKEFTEVESATYWKEWQIFNNELKNSPFLYGNLSETIEESLKLCEASIKSKNPIEFYL